MRHWNTTMVFTISPFTIHGFRWESFKWSCHSSQVRRMSNVRDVCNLCVCIRHTTPFIGSMYTHHTLVQMHIHFDARNNHAVNARVNDVLGLNGWILTQQQPKQCKSRIIYVLFVYGLFCKQNNLIRATGAPSIRVCCFESCSVCDSPHNLSHVYVQLLFNQLSVVADRTMSGTSIQRICWIKLEIEYIVAETSALSHNILDSSWYEINSQTQKACIVFPQTVLFIVFHRVASLQDEAHAIFGRKRMPFLHEIFPDAQYISSYYVQHT